MSTNRTAQPVGTTTGGVKNRSLTPEQRSHPVTGHHLTRTTLGELLDERPTLLVFLRHYG